MPSLSEEAPKTPKIRDLQLNS
uniref:Uncharacterized protein n=1 Tax=Arundo donax TaxID=35708 RepID=A0A0A8ZAY0_ARUDO